MVSLDQWFSNCVAWNYGEGLSIWHIEAYFMEKEICGQRQYTQVVPVTLTEGPVSTLTRQNEGSIDFKS